MKRSHSNPNEECGTKFTGFLFAISILTPDLNIGILYEFFPIEENEDVKMIDEKSGRKVPANNCGQKGSNLLEKSGRIYNFLNGVQDHSFVRRVEKFDTFH